MWLDRLRRERLATPPRWLPTDHLPPLREQFYPDEYLRPLTRVWWSNAGSVGRWPNERMVARGNP